MVPGTSQQADGYFLLPTLTPRYDIDPESSLGAYRTWTEQSNLDVFSYVVRAGTHIEWSQTPYTPATTYGVHMNTFYTVNWLNRWVWPERHVQQAAFDALLAGPLVDAEDPTRAAANYMSVRRLGGLRLTAPAGPGRAKKAPRVGGDERHPPPVRRTLRDR